MVLLVLALIVFVSLGVACVLYIGSALESHDPIGPIAPVGLLIAVLGAFFSLGITQIEAGHVGVVTSFGKVQDNELPPGLHYVVPLFNSVSSIDTRVKSLRFEDYTAASKEQQDLFLDATLNYHVDGTKASEIVQNIGLDFEDKIVKPRFLDIPKSVTDDYPTTIVLNSRDEIRAKSIELLTASLEPYGLIVDNIALENFSYSVEYNQSIEDKQIAQQQVQTQQQILEQKRIQAEQAVVQAEGEANATIASATGQAEANRLLTESLSDILIQYTAIQKLNDKISVILIPSDNNFLLDTRGLLETAQ